MKGTEQHDPARDKDLLEELFRHATARERPPPDDEEQIRAALHAQWMDMTGRHKRRRAIFSLAAAASIMVAALLAILISNEPGKVMEARQVAELERISGAAYLRQADGSQAGQLGAAALFETGQALMTRSGARLALRWTDGSSVRLDQNSEIRFTQEGDISLVSGRLYLDSRESDAGPGSPAILTPAGRVRHLGTQYMTAVAGGHTVVSVREGQVELKSDEADLLAQAGEQLEVDPSGSARKAPMASYGEEWQWVSEVTPAWSSDGRSIADFLEWVSLESGRAVQFASPAARQLADETVLHGDVELAPMKALEAMLQTSDLVYEVREGTIYVRLEKEL